MYVMLQPSKAIYHIIAFCFYVNTLAVRGFTSVVLLLHFTQLKHNMLFHTARAMCIAWSPDSSKIVSGGIDTNICVWNVQKGERITMIKGENQRLSRCYPGVYMFVSTDQILVSCSNRTCCLCMCSEYLSSMTIPKPRGMISHPVPAQTLLTFRDCKRQSLALRNRGGRM